MTTKEAIVGGLVAGFVGGSIIAGAVFATRPSGAIEVYGSVDVGNLPTEVYGSGPILVKLVQPVEYQAAPDGSASHPFYVANQGPMYVYSCENFSAASLAASQHCQ